MATTFNISIEAGATYSVEFEMKNEDNTIFDLTGYTGKMQVRTMPTAPDVVLEVVPTLSVLTGIIAITLTATQTATLTNSAYVYAIELYGSGGFVLRAVEGKISTSLEVVR